MLIAGLHDSISTTFVSETFLNLVPSADDSKTVLGYLLALLQTVRGLSRPAESHTRRTHSEVLVLVTYRRGQARRRTHF